MGGILGLERIIKELNSNVFKSTLQKEARYRTKYHISSDVFIYPKEAITDEIAKEEMEERERRVKTAKNEIMDYNLFFGSLNIIRNQNYLEERDLKELREMKRINQVMGYLLSSRTVPNPVLISYNPTTKEILLMQEKNGYVSPDIINNWIDATPKEIKDMATERLIERYLNIAEGKLTENVLIRRKIWLA